MKLLLICLYVTSLIEAIRGSLIDIDMPDYMVVNESFPVGSSLFNFTVSSSSGTIVSVQRDGYDTTVLVRLEITNSTNSSSVHVNVITITMFDRDGHGSEGHPGTSTVVLRFRAIDSFGNVVYAQLTVYISDINDNAPRFINTPYIWKIPERSLPGPETQYTDISAVDIDNGMNGVAGIVYQLELEAPSLDDVNGTFDIDADSGVVSLKKQVDYEAINFYQFTVIAKDQKGAPGALNASAELQIYVVDESDNPPFFVTAAYTISIQENLPVGDVVATFYAIDGDLQVGNKVMYSITDSSCGQGIMTIGLDYGVLKTATNLDADSGVIKENGGVCTLNVTASEVLPSNTVHHGPSTTTIGVYLYVTDVNDNVPEFSNDNYSGSVFKYSSIYTPVMTTEEIHIYDKDQIENAVMNLTLKWLDGSDCTEFRLSPSKIYKTGVVQLLVYDQKFIEDTSTSTLMLKVVAIETENQMHRAEAQININIMNNTLSVCEAPSPSTTTIASTTSVATTTKTVCSTNYLVLVIVVAMVAIMKRIPDLWI